MAHEYSPVARMHCTDPHGLKCRPGPYIELAGAMSASRGPCTVVRFIVWQRRLLATRLKMRNISRPWPNLSSSEGSQDISACQISGHYCQAFSIKYGNHTFEMFHWVKMPPKWVKSTGRDQNIIRWSGYSSIWYFRPFPHAFSRKCLKTLDLTRFTSFFWPVWPWNLPHDLENLGAKSSRCF